jgi:hypothetical protein
MPFPAHLTREPAIVQFVLNDAFDAFEKGDPLHERFDDLLGRGIFNADGESRCCLLKITRSALVSGLSA